MSRTFANDSIQWFRVKIAAVAVGVARSYGRTEAATGTMPPSSASAYIVPRSRSTGSGSPPEKRSFTPARMIATAGLASTTSRLKRPRISAAICPSTPRFRTFHSGWRRIIQKAYWLCGFPAPCGGASSGERKPGVPAVVESPMPTIVRARADMLRATSPTPEKAFGGGWDYFVWTRRRYACATRRNAASTSEAEIVSGPSRSDLFTCSTAGVGPATLSTAAAQSRRLQRLSGRVRAHTYRTAWLFEKKASFRSSRKPSDPMTSHTLAPTSIDALARRGSTPRHLRDETFVPKVDTYRSSNVSDTNRRTRLDLPTPGSPARAIFSVRPMPGPSGTVARGAAISSRSGGADDKGLLVAIIEATFRGPGESADADGRSGIRSEGTRRAARRGPRVRPAARPSAGARRPTLPRSPRGTRRSAGPSRAAPGPRRRARGTRRRPSRSPPRARRPSGSSAPRERRSRRRNRGRTARRR